MESTLNLKKTILILGSGMMVEPLIDTLLKRPENHLIIATNSISAYKQIASKCNSSKISGFELDVVKDTQNLDNLVTQSDIVISYLPPLLHEYIAKSCLRNSRNMVTTSYISDFMKKISSEAAAKNLIFMNEIGLDPGIDHLITHKVINECERKGSKIVHYESWCGALCSPEFLNNHLLYKFSWSPRGALNALRNNVKQLIDNKEIRFSSNEFLMHPVNKKFHACFNFEGYYNRDSLNYKELYNLKDAHTVIRGTIRFAGFAFVFQGFKFLGLFEDEEFKFSEFKNNKYGNIENKENKENKKIWRDFFYWQIICKKDNEAKVTEFRRSYIAKKKINLEEILLSENKKNLNSDYEEVNFYMHLALFVLAHFDENYLEKFGFEILFKRFYSVLQFLELFSKKMIIKQNKVLDAFADLLEEKLKMEEWERDLVFMQNEFFVKTKEGKIVNKKYDLIVFGGHNKMPYTATSLLVSLPCATATQVIFN
jgi:saccharopine dehydrogenase-like NADP-dependent oxidoreductase